MRIVTERPCEHCSGTGKVSLPHGSVSTYKNWNCRCDECTAAATAYADELRKSYAARLAADPSVVRHGLASTYLNWGCRCDECRSAVRERRNRKKVKP